MSGITLTEVADATIPTPAAGKVTVYFSTEEAGPAWKDDAAAVTALQGATGSTGATGAGYGGTSTTSLAIATGSTAFTTQAGMAYVVGSRVRAASAADPADFMEGVVTAYTGTTLTVLVDLIGGTGTDADWSLSLAGEQGIQGAGVPPTVVAHGAMGAAETFDYGDGPAHTGTVDAALTVTLAGFVAGECIMSLYLTTDGTGGYGTPTWPAAVINDADYTAWNDAAGALNVIRLWSVDGGTNVYIDIDEGGATPGLDAVIAASGVEDIAAALSGAAAPAAANVFATMADVAGGPDARLITAVASEHAISSTTGTEVTLTPTPTLAAGTYVGTVTLIAQTASTAVGPRFGINFTGTATLLGCVFRFPSTGTTAATGDWDNTAGAPAGNLHESQPVTAFSTTTPLMAPAGAAAADVNLIGFIEFVIVVTVSGDFELWHSSETATSTTVKAGTSVVIHKVA